MTALQGPAPLRCYPSAWRKVLEGCMRRLLCAAFIAAWGLVLLPCGRADAAVLVQIDRPSQTMEVSVDGMARYQWRVSTARHGYITPPGTYHPQMMARSWFSRLYYNSPMPHSIFFHGGYAIHGTYEAAHLGRPASHGCVRLSLANAATLFALVKAQGANITITGGPSPSPKYVAAAHSHHH